MDSASVTNTAYHEGRPQVKVDGVSTNADIVTYGRSRFGKAWDAENEQTIADAFRWIHNLHELELNELGIAWFDIEVIHSQKAVREWAKLHRYDKPWQCMVARADCDHGGGTISINAMAWTMNLVYLVFHEFCHILFRHHDFRHTMAEKYPYDQDKSKKLEDEGYPEDLRHEEIICDGWALDMAAIYKAAPKIQE